MKTDATRSVGPWGVDVASGVESWPGRKDHSAMAEFVARAKAAAEWDAAALTPYS